MKYIFEVHIKPGYTAEDYAAVWVEASHLIQQAPGACGTELHRHLDNPSLLIAIAHWESRALRDAMEAQPQAEVKRIIQKAAPFCEIRILGAFDEPEWIVMPPGHSTDPAV